MKAIVQSGYGTFDVLKLLEVERPIPKDDEVLLKVHATAINTGNMFMVSGKPFLSRLSSGILKPKYLNPGSDVAGRVEITGKTVTMFKPGDDVFGDNLPGGFGTFAEYVCVPQDLLALKPANISFEEAAAVSQAALVALQGLRNIGKIQTGQKIMITGASGGNGTYAVQIAKAFGAEVTAVCSTRNIELVRSLGADQAIDYTKEDFTEIGEKFDLIVAMGGYRSLKDFALVLLKGGTFVWAGGDLKGLFETMIFGPRIGRKEKKRFTNLSHQPNQSDLQYLAELIESGKVRSVIDRVFPLEETAEAFRHYKVEHMQGKVVINVTGAN
ncbi:MAG: NAD(P)-dependent alcohol dehydrogenase [Anaerolineaceae bacterium]|nr:NAD(P)-dependent alcohol dehydrogenase [Anaerolineaceae bacterium]